MNIDDLMGWVKPTQQQQDRILSSLPFPVMQDIYNPIKDTGRNQVRLLSDYVKKLHGQFIGQVQAIGDCFVGGTKVLMSDGSTKNIEDVKIGDLVISANNNICKVTNTISKKYNKNLYEIKAKGWESSLICTEDHKFLLASRKKRSDPNKQYWKPISDISLSQDRVVLPYGLQSETVEYFQKGQLAKPVRKSNNKAHNGFIRNIEYINVIPNFDTNVYCIEVENDHSFIAEGYAVHNCVSFGAAHAVDHTYAFEIAVLGDREQWLGLTSTEDIYGGSRIQIGNGQLGNGDGSIGAWAAKYVSQYGTLLRKKYDKDDLTVYSGQRAKQWGSPRVGTPAYLLPIALKTRIRSVTLIKNYEEARDALYNGYAITIASNQGFNQQRDSEGFLRPQGTWPHQMCSLPDTIIRREQSTTIDKIKINDYVFDQYGKLNKVTEVYNRPYNGKIIRIVSSGLYGNSLSLTPNHPVQVLKLNDSDYDYSENSNLILATQKFVKSWVNASDIKVGDLLISPITQHPNYDIPEWISNNKAKKKLNSLFYDDDLSWLFGLYIADGNSVKSHKIVITCDNKYPEIINRCVNTLQKLGVHPTIKYYESFARVICYSAILADSFKEWFGGGTRDKQIPYWLFDDRWNKQELINGIFDGDGCFIKNHRKRIVNTSRILCDQILEILINIGYKATLNKISYKSKTWKDRFHIEWNEKSDKIYKNYYYGNDYIYKVDKISEEEYHGLVYNFEVENSHSYIANGIVVHNCLIGVDDNYRRKGVLCLNSWPYGWVSGPTRLNMPPGSFWIDADVINRMLRDGEGWSYSDREGFPAKKLNLSKWV